MTSPISNFSGLASGVQWQDLINQIIAADTARTLKPVQDRIAAEQSQASAWSSYQGLVQKLSDAAKALQDGTAFGVFQATAGNSPTTGRTLLNVSTTSSATPGSYKVEVVDVARAEKLSGGVVADAGTALGIAGDFLINGRTVSVSSTDTLNSLRDKINAVNSGTSASKVTATILTTGGTSARLVLSSDVTGSAGISLVDGTSGALQSLGFLDGTFSLNTASDGTVRSSGFTSTTASIASALGVSVPPPTSITVNGRTISVDLSVDSIASIVARINAAGGSASTVTNTGNGTSYQMAVGGAVSAGDADGQRALELLGLTQQGRSAVAQVVTSGSALTDNLGATATTATSLATLGNGAAAGVTAGDTFTIAGKKGDGTAVSLTYTVTGSDTVQNVLDAINGAFGGGSRPATATFANGQFVLTDGTGGDSQLGFSIVANNQGGGTLDFGATSAATVGRSREVTSGTDAQVRVDGVLLSRSSNTISDAISGVTLSLQQAEAGTTVDVSVTRDLDGAMSAVSNLASAYNGAVAYVKAQGASGQPLATNNTLKTTLHTLTNVLFSKVDGLSSTNSYTQTAVAGVALSQSGTLDVDATALKNALSTNFDDVKALFSTSGSTVDGELQYVNGTSKTSAGAYDVQITAPATKGSLTGSGFSGTYADDGTGDTMTLTDGYTGRSGSITLGNGDTTDGIVTKLNAMFASQSMGLTASKSGNDLVITTTNYGTAANFTLAYTGGGTDGSAQLGFAAGTYAGTNVAGTIGGLTATGSGQVLTGDVGGATEGLAVRYTGTTARDAGNTSYVLGVSGLMLQAANAIGDGGTGIVASTVNSLNQDITNLNQRATDIQGRLDAQQAALVKRYTAMEQAIANAQAQQARLTAQLNQLTGTTTSTTG